jgi:hypothetical protein
MKHYETIYGEAILIRYIVIGMIIAGIMKAAGITITDILALIK